ncbi:MAG: universal stress protein [Trueperaceae bacterium]|nr:universal stress protein [Trueperaceae bacterium]
MIKLLIPQDGSEFSEAVLSAVENQFKAANYQLGLLRVVSMAEDVLGQAFAPLDAHPFDAQHWHELSSASDLNPSELSEAKQNLGVLKDNLLAALRQTGLRLEAKGFQVSYHLQFGDPATTIVAVAKEQGVNLIAMASHGRSGLGRMLMGSVTHDVLRQSHLPVMIVRPLIELAGQELEQGLAFSPSS